MATPQQFRVTIALRIDDAGALWDAAARQAMTILGMTMDDVAETIGDRAAPQIEDCLTFLADPMRFAGCMPTTFSIDPDQQVAVAPLPVTVRARAVAPARRRAIRTTDPIKRIDRPTYLAPL